jgi:tRNA-2-methylthio-N6-dimethylallyladenosine synthase
VGRTLRVLGDGTGKDQSISLNARTPGGRLVHLSGDPALVGSFVDVMITGSTTWALCGEVAQGNGTAG